MRGARHFTRTRSRDLRKEQTSAESRLWSALRGRRLAGYKFVRQEPVGPYFADFCCRELKLIVEVDGATHATDEERAYDASRDKFMRDAGYHVLRVQNDDVYHQFDAVCETIFMSLEERAPSFPLPAKRGEG